MTAPRIRPSMVVMDLLEVLASASEDSLAWGLSLCEGTGYGTGTVYPALNRLLNAGLITGRWEDPAPADRPRRRYYKISAAGRNWLGEQARRRESRRRG